MTLLVITDRCDRLSIFSTCYPYSLALRNLTTAMCSAACPTNSEFTTMNIIKLINLSSV